MLSDRGVYSQNRPEGSEEKGARRRNRLPPPCAAGGACRRQPDVAPCFAAGACRIPEDGAPYRAEGTTINLRRGSRGYGRRDAQAPARRRSCAASDSPRARDERVRHRNGSLTHTTRTVAPQGTVRLSYFRCTVY